MAEYLRLGAATPPRMTPLHLSASGPEAEATLRAVCNGHLPQVGERYVWLCTGVDVAATGQIDVRFLLTPLEDTPA